MEKKYSFELSIRQDLQGLWCVFLFCYYYDDHDDLTRESAALAKDRDLSKMRWLARRLVAPLHADPEIPERSIEEFLLQQIQMMIPSERDCLLNWTEKYLESKLNQAASN